MVCDLYYFYESDLDKTNIKEFYDSLPSHLQAKFKASLHGIQIGEGNVLQGYRGPSNMCNSGSGDSQELKPSHGLQEIKFWWGARKDFNYIPGVGTIIYTGCRTSQYFSGNLDWSSLYFDSHTGECLSHDEREAAEKLKSRVRKAKSKTQTSSSNCDSDDDSKHREAHAEDLNFQGDQLFDRGSYIRARDKYEEAFDISEERGPRRKYYRNLQKAQDEIDAKERFYKGNRLFMLGRYGEAEAEYRAAYDISDVDNERRIYRESAKNAYIEKCAMLFNSEGNNLFHQGRFEDAISSYERAIDISRVDERIEIYRANIANAHDEIYAVNLNSQGNDLFNEGRYWEALSEYQLACQKSQVAAQIQIYRSNIAKAQVEVDALKLNSQGHHFVSQNRYDDAISMYLEAHAKSKVSAQCQKYEANADRAKAEADADILNYRGNKLFKEGSYTAALSRYQLACTTSQRTERIKIYRANLAKAQVEIDALNFNAQGDNFFNVGRNNDAVSMYLQAYNKSQITDQKNVYLSNKNKAQDIINELNMLATLWEQAWDAESDTKNDRSGEAKDLFQKILNDSEENLRTFPGNSKFEQFKALAVLKIEGNEVFNEGFQSQKSGIALFQEAQELNQQEKYELANDKFKEAKTYFQEALEKFERGSKSDQRFAPCVGFVQDLINAVIDSIKITEQCMFSERLNKLDITSDNHSGAHFCEADVTGKHNNYSQHI